MPEKKGKDMTKFIMHGCNGAMGQVITRLAKEDPEVEIVAGIDINDRIDNGYPVFTNIQDCTVEADVIVDFSVAKAVDSVIDFAVERKMPLVLCTTGLSEDQLVRVEAAGKKWQCCAQPICLLVSIRYLSWRRLAPRCWLRPDMILRLSRSITI